MLPLFSSWYNDTQLWAVLRVREKKKTGMASAPIIFAILNAISLGWIYNKSSENYVNKQNLNFIEFDYNF